MKHFSAYQVTESEKFGGQLRSIITIMAKNREEAVKQITDQLNRNPSRKPYFDAWVKDGKIVCEIQYVKTAKLILD